MPGTVISDNAMGESGKDALRADLDDRLKLEFHGSMAGTCVLAGVRKQLVDVRKFDRIIKKTRDARGQKST